MAAIVSKRWNSYKQLSHSGWCWMYSCSYIVSPSATRECSWGFSWNCCPYFHLFGGSLYWWTTGLLERTNTGLSQNAEFSV